jgi:effector-binding domain-containing protein
MMVHVEIRQVSADPVAVVRRRARQDQLAQAIPDACGRVWNFVRASGYADAGRHVAVYLDGEINFECGVEATPSFVAGEDVHLSATPAGSAAHAVHIGPYHRLSETHAAIRDWCARHDHRFAGPSWEIYGHWTDDASEPTTDIYYLLA